MIFLAVLLVAVALNAFVQIRSRGPEFRYCGHRIGVADRLKRIVPGQGRHHCGSSRLVNELTTVAVAVRVFFVDHGRPSTNLAELQTDGVLNFQPRFMNQMIYQADGTNWSIKVLKTPSLPGFYLINSEGNVFFNEEQPAAEKDVKLRDGKVANKKPAGDLPVVRVR
jgi:hypothetical protein